MMVAPVAPHQETWHGTRPPPVPAGFKGKFDNASVPKTDNWNPDEPSGSSWVYNMPKLDDKQLDTCEDTHHHRLGNIAAIDEMVSELIQKLDDAAPWHPSELGQPARQASWSLHDMYTPETVTTVAAVPRSQESSTFCRMPCFSCG